MTTTRTPTAGRSVPVVEPRPAGVAGSQRASDSRRASEESLLRTVGLRVTAPRLAVLRALQAHPHAGVETIAAAVRERIGSVSTQAVYDVLRALTTAGLIRRIEPAGSPALFETRVGDNHHHVVCRNCGAVGDVDCAEGSAPCLHPDNSSGFTIAEAEITYWGVCPACQTESTTSTASTPTAPTPTAPTRTAPTPTAPTHAASTPTTATRATSTRPSPKEQQ